MSRFKKEKITNAKVERLGIDETITDSILSGFRVRRQRSNQRTYFVRKYALGKNHYEKIGDHGQPWNGEGTLTESKARQAALKIITDLQNGKDPKLARKARKKMPLLNEMADIFFEGHCKKLKNSTRSDYMSIYNTHIRPQNFAAKTKLDKLERQTLSKLHSDLKHKPRTANKCLQIISSMYKQAALLEYVPDINPAKGIKHYKIQARDRFLTNDELVRVGRAINEALAKDEPENLYAMTAIRLLIFTGARLNEILSLRWSWVDLDNRWLALPDSKTGKKFIMLSTPAIDILRELPRMEGNPFVICGEKEGEHYKNLHRPWYRIRDAARLKPSELQDGRLQHVRLHDLRHSYASITASSGTSLEMIGALLGHSNIATTKRYAHLAADPLRLVNEATGAIVKKAMDGESD